MRYLINTIKIIAIIAALLFLTFVIVNWGDEALKPEVAQALAWQAPTNAFDDNGYSVLLGIEAPIDMDAATIGKKALQAELARFASLQQTHKETPARAENLREIDAYTDWKDHQCDYQKQQNCVDFYLLQGDAKLAFVLASQARLIARFEAIKQSKNYTEVMPPMLSAQIPKYSSLMNASELARIRAILDIAENRMDTGLQGYVNNAMFSRKLLRESNSLVSHMVAVAMMQRDTRVLSELMTKYPIIASKYSAQLMPVLAPISAPEYNLKKAFMQATNWQIPIINNMRYANATELAGEKTNFMQKAWLKIGFKPNATLNLLNAQTNDIIKLAELNAAQFADKKAHYLAMQKENRDVVDYRLLTQKNPVGRILASISAPECEKYIERQHDLDGYLKMVRMQLALLADGTLIEKIASIELLDPYTQKQMPYDAISGVVTFNGRQAAGGNYNKSNLYKVKVN